MVEFGRHFSLLACVVAALAVTAPWRPALGPVSWFAAYGALHSATVVLTWQERQPLSRALMFVAAAISLCMLSGSAAMYISAHAGVLAFMGPALPLGVCSGLGALGYAASFRLLGARLPGRAFLISPLVCTLATELVLTAGLYRHGGGLWFAATWWFAFSASLWLLQRPSR